MTDPTIDSTVSVERQIGGEPKLWLWKNGPYEFWAFDNAFPTFDGGDPQTLGEPIGYAIFKPSTNGRPTVSDDDVIRSIERSKRKPEKTKDQTVQAPISNSEVGNGHSVFSDPTASVVARNEALEEAAKICDAEKEKRWRQSEEAYRGNPEWGEPKKAAHTQGCMSLVADDLAGAIRALKRTPEKPKSNSSIHSPSMEGEKS